MNARRLLPLLAALAVSACSTVEYVTLQPECTPPPEPVLPEISRGALWDKLGDSEYRRIESYINRLWSYSDEQSAMLGELCGPSSESGSKPGS